MSVKKNISNNIFMDQEYSDSQIGFHKLSIRILEWPLYPADTNFDRIGFTQRIKRTRLFMDENVASPIFQKFSFKGEA